MKCKKFLSMLILFILNYKIINSNYNSNNFFTNNNLFQLKNITSIHNFQNKINTSFINLRKLKQKKNLFISAFSNYKWKVVEPFFNSIIRAELKNCDIVIFVSNILESIKNRLKSYGIIVIDIPNQFGKISIKNYRFKLYEDYLKDKLDIYNIVFTSDIRDAYFQRDVFDYIQNPKPYVGIAIEGIVIYKSPRNRKWILNVFGEDVYNSIKENRVICSGTIWGTADKFYEITKAMWEIIMSKISIISKIKDQAILNYIIYYKKMFNDSLMKSDFRNGTIMTVMFLKNKDIKFDSEDNILNSNGDIASLLHQYDRKHRIVEKVKKKFCIKNKDEEELFSTFLKKKNIHTISFKNIFFAEIYSLSIILFLKIIINKKTSIKRKKNNFILSKNSIELKVFSN